MISSKLCVMKEGNGKLFYSVVLYNSELKKEIGDGQQVYSTQILSRALHQAQEMHLFLGGKGYIETEFLLQYVSDMVLAAALAEADLEGVITFFNYKQER